MHRAVHRDEDVRQTVGPAFQGAGAVNHLVVAVHLLLVVHKVLLRRDLLHDAAANRRGCRHRDDQQYEGRGHLAGGAVNPLSRHLVPPFFEIDVSFESKAAAEPNSRWFEVDLEIKIHFTREQLLLCIYVNISHQAFT